MNFSALVFHFVFHYFDWSSVIYFHFHLVDSLDMYTVRDGCVHYQAKTQHVRCNAVNLFSIQPELLLSPIDSTQFVNSISPNHHYCINQSVKLILMSTNPVAQNSKCKSKIKLREKLFGDLWTYIASSSFRSYYFNWAEQIFSLLLFFSLYFPAPIFICLTFIRRYNLCGISYMLCVVRISLR